MTIAAAHLPLCGLRGQAHRRGTCERRKRISSWPGGAWVGPRSISSHASRLCVGVLIGWQVYLKVALPLFVVGELHVAAAAGKLGISGHAWTATEGNWVPLRSSVGWPVHWRGRHLPVRCLLYAGPRATKSGHCLEKRIPARKTRFLCQCRACFPVLQKCEYERQGSGAGIDGWLNAWVSWTAPRGQRRHTAQGDVIAKTSHCSDDRPPDRKCTRHTKPRHRYCRNRGRGCPG